MSQLAPFGPRLQDDIGAIGRIGAAHFLSWVRGVCDGSSKSGLGADLITQAGYRNKRGFVCYAAPTRRVVPSGQSHARAEGPVCAVGIAGKPLREDGVSHAIHLKEAGRRPDGGG